MLRMGRSIVADFDALPEQPGLSDVTPMARMVMDDFLTGMFDEVYVMSTEFVNTMVQVPRVRPLLPLRYGTAENRMPGMGVAPPASLVEYVYEPSPREILDTVLPRFTELQIYGAILEAKASEHSARMVAMRAATDNAQELVGQLTLTYNQARQAAITKEMLDIAGGTEALTQARRRQAS